MGAFDSCLEIDKSGYGTDAALLANRGLGLIKLGRKREGVKSLRKSVKQEPSLAEHEAVNKALAEAAGAVLCRPSIDQYG